LRALSTKHHSSKFIGGLPIIASEPFALCL
jgi:hypothetical protein